MVICVASPPAPLICLQPVVWYDPFASILLFHSLESNAVGPPFNSPLPHLVGGPWAFRKWRRTSAIKSLGSTLEWWNYLTLITECFLLPSLDYVIHLQPLRGFSLALAIVVLGHLQPAAKANPDLTNIIQASRPFSSWNMSLGWAWRTEHKEYFHPCSHCCLESLVALLKMTRRAICP